MDGAKLAGVLVESFSAGEIRLAIVGTGINVLEAPLSGSTCLAGLQPAARPREVLEGYLGLVGAMLEDNDPVRESSEFIRRLLPPQTLTLPGGETVTVRGALPGWFLVGSDDGLAQVPFHSVASWGLADR